jgi:hypothetical protein
MTPQQLAVRDWIMSKVPQYHCAFCGGQTWAVGEVVVPPQAINLLASRPMVTVHCATCAHIDLFDAAKVGLVAPFA